MGSRSSPAFASRVGNSFLRKLRQKFGIFSGVGAANCFWTSFEELGYDPNRGYGFVLTNQHGMAVKLWGFVDDFLIHGESLEHCSQGLTLFLDFAVDCVFLLTLTSLSGHHIKSSMLVFCSIQSTNQRFLFQSPNENEPWLWSNIYCTRLVIPSSLVSV